MLMLSNDNAKQCQEMLMPSNAKHMLDKYQKHTDYNLGIHLQYVEHNQWMHRATLPMGVKDRGEEKKRREEKKRNAVSRAAAA